VQKQIPFGNDKEEVALVYKQEMSLVYKQEVALV